MTHPAGDDLATAVTLLFVPGDRSERFAKESARTAVVSWLAAGDRAAVRVNAPGTEHHRADLAGVLVPMAQDPQDLLEVVRALPRVPVLALVETARGVRVGAETRRARHDGFGGKLCIHPAQLAVGDGVAVVDGAMVDAPEGLEHGARVLDAFGNVTAVATVTPLPEG